MSVDVTLRHGDISKDYQEYARERVESLVETFPRVEHVHTILDVQKHHQIAECVVQAKNHIRIEAEESTDNMRTSIDRAIGKIEKQLRKERDKIQEHRARRKQADESIPFDEGDDE